MSSISVDQVTKILSHEKSLLLVGPHGVGKTFTIREACVSLGWNAMFLNGATLDAFTDLVGVPHPVDDPSVPGGKDLRMIRPHRLDNVEVLFIDEINRAPDLKTINALYDLVQFKSINGERLPKLRAVVAAMNPAGDETNNYAVNEVDPAFFDRFDFVIDVSPSVSVSYLATKFTRKFAIALRTWWDENQRGKGAYVSPRRLEMIGHNYMAIPTLQTLNASMPPNAKFDTGKLHRLLQEALGVEVKEPKKRAPQVITAKKIEKFSDTLKFDSAATRRRKRPQVVAMLNSPEIKPAQSEQLLTTMAMSMQNEVGPDRLKNDKDYASIVSHMSESNARMVCQTWAAQKRRAVKTALQRSKFKNDFATLISVL